MRIPTETVVASANGSAQLWCFAAAAAVEASGDRSANQSSLDTFLLPFCGAQELRKLGLFGFRLSEGEMVSGCQQSEMLGLLRRIVSVEDE